MIDHGEVTGPSRRHRADIGPPIADALLSAEANQNRLAAGAVRRYDA
jgi:hypothetical protein